MVKLGKRRLDKAQMAYIEYVGNSIEVYEMEQKERRFEERGIPSFWDWEMKILEQEKEFYENEVMRLQGNSIGFLEGDSNVDDVIDLNIDNSPNEESKASQVSS